MTAISELQKTITQQLDQPKELEKVYRKNKAAFQQAFNDLYPDIAKHPSAQFWNERLNYQQEGIDWGHKNELIFVLIAIFIAGLIAQIPQFTSIDENFFFPRNIGFIVLPMLTAFFAWKHKLGLSKMIFPSIVLLVSAIYINLLPNSKASDSLLLACMHLPIVLWAVLAFTFVGAELKGSQQKIDFLRYNGDLVVMSAIMALSGGLFSAITIGLFQVIGLNIQEFYAQHIIVWGAPAIPILATYLVRNNPQLVNKISPVIAKLFTPLVFSTLLAFLIALIYTGKSLYTDRNFLLLFNVLLIGVMALIVFSITEATKGTLEKYTLLLLFALSMLSIVLNGIALSAIAFRLFEFGITPNRLAVVGANLLIFANLIAVAIKLLGVIKKKATIQQVEQAIAFFLPIYGIWAAFVTFLLPLLFRFN